eukprot:TRINITY_DN4214_c0_g1_i2.p1 TRINITY_DN4214_c0_g1~~TRINITY_DN4214_c0_g1_i2.p1  ORF type:complete len:210 (-),score=30.33 TRINITY_DN4214_c0_g1_i2:18-647(-)
MREIKNPPSRPRTRRRRARALRASAVSSDPDLSIQEFACELPRTRCLEANAHKPMSAMQSDQAAELVGEGSFNGGNARASEMMAFRMLRAASSAKLVANENEVEYNRKCPCADMLIEDNSDRLGVSVTRVYDYRTNPVCFESVCVLLQKKLDAIQRAQICAKPSWRWNCSCLLYTSDAADEEDSVDLGGRRIIKKKNTDDRCIDGTVHR